MNLSRQVKSITYLKKYWWSYKQVSSGQTATSYHQKWWSYSRFNESEWFEWDTNI